jgi:hypothetical protein
VDAGAETTSDEPRVSYSFRKAYEEGAFHQFPLVDLSRLRREGEERGIRLPISPVVELERLDREGAFSPILFETGSAHGESAAVFRDEGSFIRWSELCGQRRLEPQATAVLSPWQLLYLHDAVELPTVRVSIEWLLDDDQRRGLAAATRDWYARQLERWRGLERDWRDVLLVLIRLQNRYGPSVKGTLTKRTVDLVRDPVSGDYVDPAELEAAVDAQGLLVELGIGTGELKKMHHRVATQGIVSDPLRAWHMLFRMAPSGRGHGCVARPGARKTPTTPLTCCGASTTT